MLGLRLGALAPRTACGANAGGAGVHVAPSRSVIHCDEMSLPAVIPAGEYVPTADERLVLYNVPWPALDLGPLCTFLDRRSATEAMHDFRNALRAGS